MDPRNRALLTVCVLAVLSFGVPALLYAVFRDLGSAGVTWAQQVQLSGPIAGFAATLLLLASLVSRWSKDFVSERDISKTFAGPWKVTSRSRGGTEGHCDIEASVDDAGHLTFGGVFVDREGNGIAEWEPVNIYCRSDSFAYRYHFVDRSRDRASDGFATVYVARRDPGGRPLILNGFWDEIAVQEHHSGWIHFERPEVAELSVWHPMQATRLQVRPPKPANA